MTKLLAYHRTLTKAGRLEVERRANALTLQILFDALGITDEIDRGSVAGTAYQTIQQAIISGASDEVAERDARAIATIMLRSARARARHARMMEGAEV